MDHIVGICLILLKTANLFSKALIQNYSFEIHFISLFLLFVFFCVNLNHLSLSDPYVSMPFSVVKVLWYHCMDFIRLCFFLKMEIFTLKLMNLCCITKCLEHLWKIRGWLVRTLTQQLHVIKSPTSPLFLTTDSSPAPFFPLCFLPHVRAGQ